MGASDLLKNRPPLPVNPRCDISSLTKGKPDESRQNRNGDGPPKPGDSTRLDPGFVVSEFVTYEFAMVKVLPGNAQPLRDGIVVPSGLLIGTAVGTGLGARRDHGAAIGTDLGWHQEDEEGEGKRPEMPRLPFMRRKSTVVGSMLQRAASEVTFSVLAPTGSTWVKNDFSGT